MAPILYYGLGTVFVFFGLVFFSVGSILSGGLSFLIGIYIVNRGVVVSRDRYEEARKLAEEEEKFADQSSEQNKDRLNPKNDALENEPEKNMSEKGEDNENS